MRDTPYRVECRPKEAIGLVTIAKRYAIMRSGYDPVCYCDDVTFAYRIVDLLNEEEADAQRTAAADRRVHQNGLGQGLVDAA
jgi:hypothetical protein